MGDEGGNDGDEKFSDLDGLVGRRFNGVAASPGRKLIAGLFQGESWQEFAENDASGSHGSLLRELQRKLLDHFPGWFNSLRALCVFNGTALGEKNPEACSATVGSIV